jgi:hypothetical protein
MLLLTNKYLHFWANLGNTKTVQSGKLPETLALLDLVIELKVRKRTQCNL